MGNPGRPARSYCFFISCFEFLDPSDKAFRYVAVLVALTKFVTVVHSRPSTEPGQIPNKHVRRQPRSHPLTVIITKEKVIASSAFVNPFL